MEGTTCSDVLKVEPHSIIPEWVMGRLYPLLIWLHTAIKEWSPFDRGAKNAGIPYQIKEGKPVAMMQAKSKDHGVVP